MPGLAYDALSTQSASNFDRDAYARAHSDLAPGAANLVPVIQNITVYGGGKRATATIAIDVNDPNVLSAIAQGGGAAEPHTVERTFEFVKEEKGWGIVMDETEVALEKQLIERKGGL